MAQINYAEKSISCKVVYYGPGVSGKTTNLQIIYEKTPENSKGNMVSLKTEGDRTLYFDFLPLDLGQIKGFATKFQLYTVPGQIYYNATRKLVLKGVDAVVFIADSSKKKREENIESLENLEENLRELNLVADKDIPLVIQYNKRDIPDAMPIEEMRLDLNKWGVPDFEAVAVESIGVFKTLKSVAKLFIQGFHEKYGFEVDYEEEKSVELETEVPEIKKEESSINLDTGINLDDNEDSIDLDNHRNDTETISIDNDESIDIEETSYNSNTDSISMDDEISLDLETTSHSNNTTEEIDINDNIDLDITDNEISIDNNDTSINDISIDNSDINIEIPEDSIDNLDLSDKTEEIPEDLLGDDILKVQQELKEENSSSKQETIIEKKPKKAPVKFTKKVTKGTKTFVKRKKKKSLIEKISSLFKK